MSKAPDKIYLGIQDMGSGYVYALSLDNNGEQEYIRKEALLNKIDEILATKPDTGGLAVEVAAQAISDIRKIIMLM